MRALLRQFARELLLLPVVAVVAWWLMAALPLPSGDEAKRALPPELYASYRRDLGLGQPFGFVRPWQKLLAGERLGTSAQGVTAQELLSKLGRSVQVGSLALLFACALAVVAAGLRLRFGGMEWLSALALGTPVFLSSLLLAPRVVEAGHGLPQLAAAGVLSVWPGVFLGGLLFDALTLERARDYVRTAKGKGVSPVRLYAVHVFPNVLPALLDAFPPVATALLAGSFAAERVLGLPYFGQLYVQAVLQKQIAVVVVATTLFAAVLVSVRLVVAVVRRAVDPRVREEVP